ncbi:hypothetical protein J5X84_39210 [Streptosporangiaceae bacterium NEAU-GS5]|nr:hypothetical protein [Streptosporangiaceae bacterium NEAU-GS5]
MGDFLAEIGKRLADRWFVSLVLPGLPLLAAAFAGWSLGPLGPTHALDPGPVAERLSAWLGAERDVAALVVGGGVLVAGLAGTAVAIRELSKLLARLWLGEVAWLRLMQRRLIARRRRRAIRGAPAGHRVPDRYLPRRGTVIGDRFLLAEERFHAQYGVSLARAWPRLWLLSDDTGRAPVQAAWEEYAAAIVRTTWGVPYLVVAAVTLWWPAVVLGAGLITLGWLQGRRSATDLAVVCEALADVTLRPLALTLGVALPHGRVTVTEGAVIDSMLDKGTFVP